MLEKGSQVTLKVKNILWPKRHLYAAGVIRDEFNYYTGTVVYEKWFKADQVGLTTDLDWFPFRVIQKENIVEVNDLPVDYSQPASDRVEKTVEGSKGNVYTVIKEDGRITCTCPGFTFRGQCKHMAVVA